MTTEAIGRSWAKWRMAATAGQFSTGMLFFSDKEPRSHPRRAVPRKAIRPLSTIILTGSFQG